jgi:DNA polymerase
MNTAASKTDGLRQIRDEVLALTSSPLYEYRTQNKYFPVIGEGSHDATIMFVGEAPGESEAKTGRPFCGASGKFLDVMLQSIGLDRKAVYVANVVKDRPPGNRDPEPEEIALYGPFLLRQIAILKPRVIATLGRFSLQYLLTHFQCSEAGLAISKLHGKPLVVDAGYGPITLLPLYHPAAALYNGSLRETQLADFAQLKEFIK